MYGNITLAVINALTTLIEVMLAALLTDSLFEFRFQKKAVKYIALAAAAAIIFAVNMFAQSYALRTPIEILIIVLLMFLYHGSIKYRIVCCTVWTVTLSLSNILSSIVISALPEEISIFPNETVFISSVKIILPKIFLMTFIFLLSSLTKEKGQRIDIKYWMIMLIVPLVTIVVLTVFQYYIAAMPEGTKLFESESVITINGEERTVPWLSVYGYILIATIGLLFINILVFILFTRIQKNLDIQNRLRLLSQQTELQSQSIEKLETSYMRMRELRHDMQNQLLIMNSLIENKKYDDLRKYIKTMVNTVDEAAFMTISGQSAVDAILNEKLLSAHKNKISTNFDIAKLDNIFAEPMDLCIILANALDNAVEACVKLPEEAERYIKLKIAANDEYIVVSCSNPTTEAPKKINNEYVSTKRDKKNHGLGINCIKTTADKYNGEYMIRCKDNVFTLLVKLNNINLQTK